MKICRSMLFFSTVERSWLRSVSGETCGCLLLLGWASGDSDAGFCERVIKKVGISSKPKQHHDG